ncbi:MAG: SCO family protein [Pseudomonadota bacterium]
MRKSETFVIGIMVFIAVYFAVSLFSNSALKLDNASLVQHSQQPEVATPGLEHRFELLDVNGKVKTPRSFPGRYHLVYFGYTSCPDICPASLGKISVVLDELGNKIASRITPLFISVDPEVDKPAELKAYMGQFDSRIVALTPASKAELTAMVDSYRLVVQQQPNDASGARIIDHTALIYLFNPDGAFVTFFSPDQDATIIAVAVSNAIAEGK